MAKPALLYAGMLLFTLTGSGLPAATPTRALSAPFDLSGVWMNDNTLHRLVGHACPLGGHCAGCRDTEASLGGALRSLRRLDERQHAG